MFSPRDDRGYAVLLAALVMIPMLGFVALVVDVGSWYARDSSLTRAADAAALAGVVWLPDVGAATAAAQTNAIRNGFDAADPDISITVIPLGDTELKVTITDNDVPLYFAGLFMDSKSLSGSATAEYVKSVPMGNPESYLGTDPERGLAEDNYLSMSGAGTPKKGGDRFASKNCDAALCTPGPLGNLPANGGEYREDGYVFTTRVNALTGNPITIEVYDPGHYAASQTCANHGNLPAGYDFADLLTGGLASMFPGDGASDPARIAHWTERYANSPGAIYCTGDTPAAGPGGVTTFIVREPDLTPFDDLDNTPVCVAQFDSYDENFYALLEQVGTGHAYADTFAQEFRRWVEICTVTPTMTGDYIIQVKNNAPMGSPLAIDPAAYDGGRNHFSLRARWDDGSAWNGTNLELFANGAMAIDANVPGSSTEMELARVTEVYAGQTLRIEMWDVADASAAGTLTILPPVEPEAPAAFTDCDFSNTLLGWSDSNPADCSTTVTNAGMNGQLLTAEVGIPLGYDCAEGSSTGCYIRVLVDFPAGTTVYDHTTWSIELSGDPIRLVE